MQANPKTASRILSRCLSGALGQALGASDLPANQNEWEKVLRSASAHLAAPQLRWALREQGLFSALPADVAEYLEAVYTLNIDRNRECEDQLAHLIQALNSIDVRPVLLKGAAALVGRLYPTSGERMISDLDILIPARQLPEIFDKLASVGYRPWVYEGTELPDPVGFCSDHHYPPLVNTAWPTHVELHVHPVHLGVAELLSSEEVFRDATKLAWRNGDCLLPSQTHFIAHNIIHAFLNDAKIHLKRLSLRQLFEFVLASRVYGERIDWNDIRNRFEGRGHGKALRQYLALAHSYFDFDGPRELSIDFRDSPDIRRYLIHLDSSSRTVLWTFNLAQQLKGRFLRLKKRPGMTIKKLFSTGAYARLINSIFHAPRN